MDDNEIEFQNWMENESIEHVGNYKYLYNNNLYTLDQLEALFRVLRLLRPAQSWSWMADRWSNWPVQKKTTALPGNRRGFGV